MSCPPPLRCTLHLATPFHTHGCLWLPLISMCRAPYFLHTFATGGSREQHLACAQIARVDGPSRAECWTRILEDGTMEIRLLAHLSGEYRVYVSLSGTRVLGSPYTLQASRHVFVYCYICLILRLSRGTLAYCYSFAHVTLLAAAFHPLRVVLFCRWPLIPEGTRFERRKTISVISFLPHPVPAARTPRHAVHPKVHPHLLLEAPHRFLLPEAQTRLSTENPICNLRNLPTEGRHLRNLPLAARTLRAGSRALHQAYTAPNVQESHTVQTARGMGGLKARLVPAPVASPTCRDPQQAACTTRTASTTRAQDLWPPALSPKHTDRSVLIQASRRNVNQATSHVIV